MEYATPMLTLVGRASGVILGTISPFEAPSVPGDSLASLEAEW